MVMDTRGFFTENSGHQETLLEQRKAFLEKLEERRQKELSSITKIEGYDSDDCARDSIIEFLNECITGLDIVLQECEKNSLVTRKRYLRDKHQKAVEEHYVAIEKQQKEQETKHMKAEENQLTAKAKRFVARVKRLKLRAFSETPMLSSKEDLLPAFTEELLQNPNVEEWFDPVQEILAGDNIPFLQQRTGILNDVDPSWCEQWTENELSSDLKAKVIAAFPMYSTYYYASERYTVTVVKVMMEDIGNYQWRLCYNVFKQSCIEHREMFEKIPGKELDQPSYERRIGNNSVLAEQLKKLQRTNDLLIDHHTLCWGFTDTYDTLNSFVEFQEWLAISNAEVDEETRGMTDFHNRYGTCADM